MKTSSRGKPQFGLSKMSARTPAGSRGRTSPSIERAVKKRPFSKWHLFEGVGAFQAKALALLADRGLIAAGIGAAIGSALFAGFMISRDNRVPAFDGGHNLGRFSQPHHIRPHQAQIGAEALESRRIDYSVTGSILRGDVGTRAQSAVALSNFDKGNTIAGGIAAKTYVLRFVHEGVALLQSARGFYVAKRGTLLPDAGRILSIERRGDR